MNSDEIYPDEIQAKFAAIETELGEIKETLAFIQETMVNADTTITKVAAEVMPTINSLLESPMLKMLMPKSKTTSRGGN